MRSARGVAVHSLRQEYALDRMDIRVRFSKYGPIKYVGHLDLMRYFQKALRRSNLSVSFSKGFSPHPIMSFASPLGVGITSEGEYMDFSLDENITPEEIKDALNEQMADGAGRQSLEQSLLGQSRSAEGGIPVWR